MLVTMDANELKAAISKYDNYGILVCFLWCHLDFDYSKHPVDHAEQIVKAFKGLA